MKAFTFPALTLLHFFSITTLFAQSWITSVSPERNALNVQSGAPFAIISSVSLDPATVTSSTIRLSGEISGIIPWSSVQYDEALKKITLLPSKPYSAGERLTLSLFNKITGTNGAPRSAAIIQFRAAFTGGSVILQDTSTTIPIPNAMGFSSADIDHDGFPDLVLNDIMGKIHLYKNNGNKTFTKTKELDALVPYEYAGKNVAGDFDGDGDVDITLQNKWGLMYLFTNNADTYTRKEFSVYFGGMNPDNMVTAEPADLNGDGMTDFMIPNGNDMVNSDLSWASTTVVALNNGNGTFTKSAVTSGGGGNGTIASGDIDNDGDIDAAVTNVHNGFPYTISILTNDGNGNFTKTGADTVQSDVRAMAFADADNDHDLDFIVSSSGNNWMGASSLIFHMNDGNGNFTESPNVIRLGFQPTDIRLCDLNGDGTMDIVATNNSRNTVSVIEQTINGNFVVQTIGTRSGPYIIQPIDLDRDGDPDLAVLTNNALQIIWNESISVHPAAHDFGILPWNKADTVRFRITNADPVKSATLIASSLTVPAFSLLSVPGNIPPKDSAVITVRFAPPSSVLFRDTLKLTFANSETLSFSIPLSGTTQPLFSFFPPPYSHAADTGTMINTGNSSPIDPALLSPQAIAVHGSISGLHPGTFASYDIGTHILSFDPKRPFLPGENVRVSLTPQLKDKNGDTLATPKNWEFSTTSFSGSGKFIIPSNVTSGGWSYITLYGDFNKDGSIDLANIGGTSCNIFLNNGAGTFTLTSSVTMEYSGSYGCVGDIDNNGTLDIVIALGHSQSFVTLKNNGAGTFTLQPKQLSSPYSLLQCELADMNSDGFLDLVAINDYSHVFVGMNDHTGGFGVQFNSAQSGRYSSRMALADFDGDGDLDVVTNAESEMIFYANNGNGILSHVRSDTIQVSVIWMKTADLNNDGRPDIAVGQGNTYEKEFYVLFNNKNFTFTKKMFGAPGKGTGMLAVNDFDSDGDLDIVIKNTVNPTASIYENVSNGDFSGIPMICPAGYGNDLIAADLNCDGTIDLGLLLSDPQQPITVLRNRRRTPTLSFTPSVLSFGKSIINKTVFKSLRIYNEGTEQPLTVTLSQQASGVFGASPVNISVDPLDSVDVLVTFLPTQGKLYADTLILTTNDPLAAQRRVIASGTGIAKPSAPAQLFPADSALYVPASVSLSWQNEPTADYYHLQVFKGSLVGPKVIDMFVFGTLKKADSLDHSTQYIWRVSSVNIAGEGTFSPVRIFTTLKNGPSGIIVKGENYQTVSVWWNAISDTAIKEYFLYTGSRPDSLVRSDSVLSGVTTIMVGGMETGRIYYYAVSGVDADGHETDRTPTGKYAIPYFAVAQNLGQSTQTAVDAAWGDFDDDNDLDLIVTGFENYERRTTLYQNRSDTLVNIWSFIPGTYNSFVEWGDFDGDGDLDLLHGNYNETTQPSGSVTEIYINNGAGIGSTWNFTKLDNVLPGEYPSWADMDNDGDLDVFTSGRNTILYLNNGAAPANKWKFTPVDLNLYYVLWRSFGDFNGDGRLDIGDIGLANDLRILQNNGNTMFPSVFIDYGFGYSQGGEAQWSDMNNDRRLDLCANGGNNGNALTRIYFNSGGSGSTWNFTRKVFPNTTYENGKIVAGDFNNDGRNDFIFSGRQNSGMFLNKGTMEFSGTVAGFDTTQEIAGMTAGDFNNDGRLDAVFLPYQSSVRIFRNILPKKMTFLPVPSGLKSEMHGDTAILRWDPLTDSSLAVTYNVFVDTGSGKYFVSPNADVKSGFRKVVANGNAGTTPMFKVRVPRNGKYRWSVQTVAGTYLGSAFAAIDTFSVNTLTVVGTDGMLPSEFSLEQNYPNPFNPVTTIQFALPRPGNILLEVYTTLGQKILSVKKDDLPSGIHREMWDAHTFSSGMYLYRIIVTDPSTGSVLFRQTKRLLLVK